MAKIGVIKQCVHICKEANVTPFIWGERGLGKSSLVRQLTQEDGWGFIDYRISQCEASDVRGLPDRSNGRTAYLPPEDMPVGDMTLEQFKKELGECPFPEDFRGNESAYRAAVRVYNEKYHRLQPRLEQGILFLDEVNRGQDDVLQAVFQLVLDRRVGQYTLPPGWGVVAAGNFMEGYQVSGFSDPAFLDRFCHITLSAGESTLEEWVSWMASMYGDVATDIVEFTSSNVEHLDGQLHGELGFKIQPSRRSWERVAQVEQVCRSGKYSPEAKHAVIAGLVGQEMAIAYAKYSCPVKPRDLLANGVKPYAKQLAGLQRTMLVGLMWGLVSHAKQKVDEDEKVATVCLDFIDYALKGMNDKDVIVAFCRALVNRDGQDNQIMLAAITNTQIAALLAKANKGKGKKTFLDRLNDRPELQQLMAKVAWGR